MPATSTSNNSAVCTILAIAGTGSTTLHHSFAKAIVNQHKQPASTARKFLNVHDHTLTLRNAKLEPCFVATLRDPVARLQSAFAKHPVGNSFMGRKSTQWHGATPWKTLAQFIACHRNRSALCHRHAVEVVQHSAQPKACCDYRQPPMDFFLTPQIYYVTGRNVSKLYIICLENYEHDLALVLGLLGLPFTSGVVRSSTRRGMAGITENILISNEDKAYIRNQLFPDDTLLHAQRCGISIGEKAYRS